MSLAKQVSKQSGPHQLIILYIDWLQLYVTTDHYINDSSSENGGKFPSRRVQRTGQWNDQIEMKSQQLHENYTEPKLNYKNALHKIL